MDRTSTQRQIDEKFWKIICSQAPMTFAAFMELALYHPIYGYYAKPSVKLGKSGDFFTNVHVSDLFGRVIANAFLRYWQQNDASDSLQLVEMGGGDGSLMHQIIAQFQEKKVSPSHIHFYSIEKSSYHQLEQQKRLQNSPYLITWVKEIEDIPTSTFSIVYSHELIDAFPVHRLIWKEGRWQEIYIAVEKEKLVERVDALSSKELQKYTESIPDDIVEGQQIEVNREAKKWLQNVTNWLEKGMIWTLDYGGTARELHSIRYLEGTLRYYQKHQHIDNPYVQAGNIDMTAHVNFDDLMHWGESFGWTTSFYGSQAKFLVDAGILDYSQPKYRNAIKQLLTGMGEHFQVLVQCK